MGKYFVMDQADYFGTDLAEGDEHDAVIGSSHHLDCPRGDDEHLHSNISFLLGLALTLSCCF